MRRAFSKPTSTETDFQRLMTTFRDEGYEGLQLKMGQFMPWVDDVDGFVERFGEDAGQVSALIFFDTLDAEGTARLDAAVRFAQAVGSERVVFCHNHPRDGVSTAQLVEFARAISTVGVDAAQRGVRLSLHHHHNQPVMHPEDFDVFFGAIEPGSVGLTVDTAHLAKSGIGDIPSFIRDRASTIDNVHFKDYSDGEWRLLGQGSLNLEGILEALEQSGYNGWLCVDEESDADLPTGLKVSREWLDRHPAVHA